MGTDGKDAESKPLSADEAFSLLGNEVRVEILRGLGLAGQPLSFSELRRWVGYEDPGNFQYHLNKLTGHFVRKTEDGYELHQAGKRVVIAVLSGTITDHPPREQQDIDEPCPLCDEPIRVELRPRGVAKYCTACDGLYETDPSKHSDTTEDFGFLGILSLPPAGLRDRTPEEAYRAAQIWNNLKFMTLAHDLCGWCSGTLEHEVDVCEDHDASEGRCDECGHRLPIWLRSACTNCIVEHQTTVGARVYGREEMQKFILDHGADPVSSTASERPPFDHEVLSTNPFEGKFIYRGIDETLEITLDENLDVVDVSREPTKN